MAVNIVMTLSPSMIRIYHIYANQQTPSHYNLYPKVTIILSISLLFTFNTTSMIVNPLVMNGCRLLTTSLMSSALCIMKLFIRLYKSGLSKPMQTLTISSFKSYSPVDNFKISVKNEPDLFPVLK